LLLWQSAGARSGKEMTIPELDGNFDTLVEAQAAGDFEVLCDRDRRIVGIDVGPDPAATLTKLTRWIEAALA
jgi:hypothetical protein